MKKNTTHDTNPASGMTPEDYENGLRALLARRSKLAREAQIGRRVSEERWLYYRRDLVSLNDYILGVSSIKGLTTSMTNSAYSTPLPPNCWPGIGDS